MADKSTSILILIKTWRGGVGNAVKNLQSALNKKGISVKVISREEDLRSMTMISSFFPLRSIAKKFVGLGHDNYVYTQDWSLAFPLLFPANISQSRHFCCFHGEEVNAFSKFLQKLVGNKIGKRLIVVGDNLKKIFPDSNLIYNGIDRKLFRKQNAKMIKNSIGYANWKTEEYHFSEIRSAARSLKKKFIIAEKIPMRRMPLFYSKLDTFVSLPGENTGFGMSWLEAMSCGVKKVLGNNNGVGKILPIDKVENYSSVKDAISKIKPRDYSSWMKKNKDLFSWDSAADKLINLFCGKI